MKLAASILLKLFVCPWLAIIAVLFAKKTDKKGTHYGQPNVQRYKLPKLLAWMETPDELLPGGLYEPTVKKIYDKYGWRIASWYWIGIRNGASFLNWVGGKEVKEKIKETKAKKVLFFYIVTGTKTYNDRYFTRTKSGFWAVKFSAIRTSKTL